MHLPCSLDIDVPRRLQGWSPSRNFPREWPDCSLLKVSLSILAREAGEVLLGELWPSCCLKVETPSFWSGRCESALWYRAGEQDLTVVRGEPCVVTHRLTDCRVVSRVRQSGAGLWTHFLVLPGSVGGSPALWILCRRGRALTGQPTPVLTCLAAPFSVCLSGVCPADGARDGAE